jgi:FkbM family methyltransferase
MLLGRLTYYATSIPTLFTGFRNPLAMFAALASRRSPLDITLVDGTRYTVRGPMDVWAIKETCLNRDYEAWQPRQIQDGWTVIDIGGGLGDFAVHVGRRFPNARVLAFEPFSESYALLTGNITANGVRNVTAVPNAVSSDGRPMVLQRTGDPLQHSTQDGAEKRPGSEQVKSVTLAEVLQTHQIARVDLLKIDCEGGEFDILLNMPDDVLARVDRISLEWHDNATTHTHTELAARLRVAGFQVRERPSPVHSYLGLMYAWRV